jgi:hypothetical protein
MVSFVISGIWISDGLQLWWIWLESIRKIFTVYMITEKKKCEHPIHKMFFLGTTKTVNVAFTESVNPPFTTTRKFVQLLDMFCRQWVLIDMPFLIDFWPVNTIPLKF